LVYLGCLLSAQVLALSEKRSVSLHVDCLLVHYLEPWRESLWVHPFL